MLNENAQKWVAALRSGEYTQTRKRLRDPKGFCCLGVACELYRQDHPESKWVDDSVLPGETRFMDGNWDYGSWLPRSVRDWLGLREMTGEYFPNGRGGSHTTLAGENDMGVNFNTIANIIESEPEGLFGEGDEL